MESHTHPHRIGWFTDAKWIVGLLFTLAVGCTLILWTASKMTEKEQVVPALGLALASMMSPDGLDAPFEDLDQLTQKLPTGSDGTIQPFPGLLLTIDPNAVKGLPPREARLTIFENFVKPVYETGLGDVIDPNISLEQREQFLHDGQAFNLLTRANHDTVRQWAVYATVATSIFGLLLVFFSYRFGRLVSLGWGMVLGALPMGAIVLIASTATKAPPAAPSFDGGTTALGGYLAQLLLPIMLKPSLKMYIIVICIGIACIVFGYLLNLLIHPKTLAVTTK